MLRITRAGLSCALVSTLVWTASLASCGRSKKPIVVGSKNETEEMVLGEIVAQHLEHRLGRTVERRTGLGGTALLYQSLLSGEVGIYPEYTGLIESEILKEQANADPQIVLTRVRGEMDRVQFDLMDPLGFDNRTAMVVSAAGNEKIASLSDAAGLEKRWKMGLTYEFQSRSDGLQDLAPYRLQLAAPRILEVKQLFAELEKGNVDMIAARVTDGRLTSPDWKVLADDRMVFPPYEACLLVRKDVIAAEPGLRPALAELSGKFSAEIMRKLNAQADVEHRPLAAVATDFLTQAGLK